MLKIMIKEPVGGLIRAGTPARQIHYMLAKGEITDDLSTTYDEALVAGKSMWFITPEGKNFLVAAFNIAYILESDEQPTR